MTFKAGQQARVSTDSLYFAGVIVEALPRDGKIGQDCCGAVFVSPVSERGGKRRTAYVPKDFLEPLDGPQDGPEEQE